MTPATEKTDEYSKALEKAFCELESRVEQRDILNAEIAGLRETVRILSSRISLPKDAREKIAQLLAMVDYATPTLKGSISTVLAKAFPRRMSAIEVRNALDDSGFDFGEFSNSLSACHAALKRMLAEGEVDAEITKDRKVAYRRILKLTPPPAPYLSTLAEMMKKAKANEQNKVGGITDLLGGNLKDLK